MTIRRFKQISPNIAPSAWVDDTALVIGDVTIGADSSVWPMAVIRGDVNTITIGERTNIQDGCILHVNHASPYNAGSKLTIGDDVTIGHRVILHGCRIENSCLIGMAAVIMDDAVVGAPAKRVRTLGDEIMAQLQYSAAHYVQNKDDHRNNT